MYYSLQYLPLADCTVLTFLAPGLVCWVCSILIKEPFTRIEKIATVISFTGVILIARPTSFFSSPGDVPASGDGDVIPGTNVTTPIKTPSDASDYDNVTAEQRLRAVAIAMLGVCGTVVAFTTIRWIGKRAHPLISVNYFAAWCTVVSFVMQFILPGVGFLLPADAKEWAYLIFLGICGFVMVRSIPAIATNSKSSSLTSLLAIPACSWPFLRKVIPRYEHDLHADAIRSYVRQVLLWTFARMDVDLRIHPYPRASNLRSHAEE